MKHIYVAAGILLNKQDQVLIAQRPKGSDMELLWEFPGGKLEQDETPQQAIVRELNEELGIQSEASEILFEETFQYPDKIVTLYFVKIDTFSPEPKALEHQEIRWVNSNDFPKYDFPLADLTFLKSFDKLLRN